MGRMDVSLGDYLVKNPREAVPLHKKVSILLQVAEDLSYLHGHTPPLARPPRPKARQRHAQHQYLHSYLA